MNGRYRREKSNATRSREGAARSSDEGRANPESRRPGIASLQQAGGNQAVARLAREGRLGPGEDRFEREAARVADAVGSAGTDHETSGTSGTESARTEPSEAATRTTTASAGRAGDRETGRLLGSASGGRPPPASVREPVEERLGEPLAGVRIHTGPAAARSAAAMGARAYTLGRNVVFGANEYAPDWRDGRQLLAHELTHAAQQGAAGRDPASSQQQGGAPATRVPGHGTIVQRQTLEKKPATPETDQTDSYSEPVRECGATLAGEIDNHIDSAESWRRDASSWLRRHWKALESKVRRAAAGRGTRRLPVGPTIADQLGLLDEHFDIASAVAPIVNDESKGIRNEQRLPESGDTFSASGFERLRNLGETRTILNNFENATVDHPFKCGSTCPTGSKGSDVVGEAHAGSGEFAIYEPCWREQGSNSKTGIVLHEGFHASFAAFDHDTYFGDSSYPGPSALTNADSYAHFASVVATGSDFGVVDAGVTTIEAKKPGSGKQPTTEESKDEER